MTQKKLPQEWHIARAAFLVQAHGFFMIRAGNMLEWKPVNHPDEFVPLVTSREDRVFGSMVKAQQEEDKKSKEKEKATLTEAKELDAVKQASESKEVRGAAHDAGDIPKDAVVEHLGLSKADKKPTESPDSKLEETPAKGEAPQKTDLKPDSGAKDKKDQIALIWKWNTRSQHMVYRTNIKCEKWRWKNYQSGLGPIEAGGWEERDMMELADGLGCKDFAETMWRKEQQEVDIHDWGC
jgi:hypothetical protein